MSNHKEIKSNDSLRKKIKILDSKFGPKPVELGIEPKNQKMENSFIEASKQLHLDNKNYGAASEYSDSKTMKFRLTIPTAIKAAQNICPVQSLLDHGTGQGGLISTLTQDQSLQINAQGYDPGVPTFSNMPTSKYDVVTSIDVLEHIGKPFIQSTLKEISGLTAKFFFFCIDLLPASKTTADGRNAHFLIAPSEWWITQIKNEFKILTFIEVGEMPDGTSYPMHLFGCATNSMKNFQCMNKFLENIDIANKEWLYAKGKVLLKDYQNQ